MWRRYSARTQACRAVEIVHCGDRTDTQQFVAALAGHLGLAVWVDGEHARLWLTEASEGYPRLEEFFVATPNAIRPKMRPGFETRWSAHTDHRLRALEQAAAQRTGFCLGQPTA